MRVIVAQGDAARRTCRAASSIQISLMRSVGSSPSAAAGGVQPVLEAVHRNLAEDGGEAVLDLLRQHRQPHRRIGFFLHQVGEGQHFAEGRRHFGGRQRRVQPGDALRFRREVHVHAVTEFVRQRHHVARLPGEIDKHERVRRRHGRRGERAAALVGHQRRVNPVFVEEAPDDLADARAERRVGLLDNRPRLRPSCIRLLRP